MDQRTKPYFYSFNTKAKPGKLVAHCVRVETQELRDDIAKETNFTLLGADVEKDPRLLDLLACGYRFVKSNPTLFPGIDQ